MADDGTMEREAVEVVRNGRKSISVLHAKGIEIK